MKLLIPILSVFLIGESSCMLSIFKNKCADFGKYLLSPKGMLKTAEFSLATLAYQEYGIIQARTNWRMNKLIRSIETEYKNNIGRRTELDGYLSQLRDVSINYNKTLKESIGTGLLIQPLLGKLDLSIPLLTAIGAGLYEPMKSLLEMEHTIKVIDWKMTYPGATAEKQPPKGSSLPFLPLFIR